MLNIQNILSNTDLDILTLILIYIKQFIFAFTTLYSFNKIINATLEKNNIINIFIFSLLISLFYVILSTIFYPYYIIILYFLILIVILKIYYKLSIFNTIIYTALSYSFSFLIYFFSTTIDFIIMDILKIESYYIHLLFITLIHIFIITRIFKIKKLKNGFDFLNAHQNNELFNIILLNITCSIIFIYILLDTLTRITVIKFTFTLFIFLIIMTITIRKSFKLYYKQKLFHKEFDDMKLAIIEKDNKIAELEKNALEFSKKSHSIDHEQKSLKYKIKELENMVNVEASSEIAVISEKVRIIDNNLVSDFCNVDLVKIGISDIDDMLSYLKSECDKDKIEIDLKVYGNIHYITNHYISVELLTILIADMVKNAMITINHSDNLNRSILIKIGIIGDSYGLYVYDSGIEFEIDTLKNLGVKPASTHLDCGGSGMGFMNTFETLKNHNLKFTIEEINVPSNDNYTKILSVEFDSRFEYLIKSYRYEELKKIKNGSFKLIKD